MRGTAGARDRRDRVVAAACWVGVGALAGWMLLASRTVKTGGTSGDFPVFYWAGLRMPLGENIYEKPTQAGEYIYPPLLAAVFTPLAKLGQANAALVWSMISAALFVAIAILTGRAVGRALGLRPVAVAAAALLGSLVFIDKARATINGGQTDMLMVAGGALGMVWCASRPALAGFFIALAANIKYTPLMMLALLGLRGRWRTIGWTVACFVALALAPALVTGWSKNLDHWSIALGGVARLFGYSGGTAFAGSIQDAAHPLSISITSGITRSMTPQPGKTAALVVSGLVALVVGAVSWGLYAERRTPFWTRADEWPGASFLLMVEWSGILVALCAFSPQTQGRHLVVLMPVGIVAAGLLVRRWTHVPRWPLVVGVGIAVLGMTMPPGGPRFNDAVWWWRSHGGAGWCLLPLWFALLWTALRVAPEIEPKAPPVTTS
jgi:hypothetical protein